MPCPWPAGSQDRNQPGERQGSDRGASLRNAKDGDEERRPQQRAQAAARQIGRVQNPAGG